MEGRRPGQIDTVSSILSGAVVMRNDARYTDINNCHDTSYYYCDGIYYEIIRNIMFSKAKREFRCNKL